MSITGNNSISTLNELYRTSPMMLEVHRCMNQTKCSESDHGLTETY